MPIVVSGGATQTPASRTLSSLQTQVLRYIGMPDHTEGQAMAMDELNNAVGDLNRRNWNWALTSQDITSVASTKTYSLSANFGSARMCFLLNSSGKATGKLSWFDPKSLDEAFESEGTTGNPVAYTVQNFTDTGLISLDVAPTDTWVASYPTIRLRYYARIPTMSNASDTLPVPSAVEQFVIWKARLVCCLSTDPDGARMSMARSQASSAWQELVKIDCENNFNDWE